MAYYGLMVVSHQHPTLQRYFQKIVLKLVTQQAKHNHMVRQLENLRAF